MSRQSKGGSGQSDPRHSKGSACRCYLPVLTGLADFRRADSDLQRLPQRSLNISTAARTSSADMRSPFKCDDVSSPYVAEREGFEPSRRFKRLHAFQACLIDRSSTSPRYRSDLKVRCFKRLLQLQKSDASNVCYSFKGPMLQTSVTASKVRCFKRKRGCASKGSRFVPSQLKVCCVRRSLPDTLRDTQRARATADLRRPLSFLAASVRRRATTRLLHSSGAR
jgi:hypothetical protein